MSQPALGLEGNACPQRSLLGDIRTALEGLSVKAFVQTGFLLWGSRRCCSQTGTRSVPEGSISAAWRILELRGSVGDSELCLGELREPFIIDNVPPPRYDRGLRSWGNNILSPQAPTPRLGEGASQQSTCVSLYHGRHFPFFLQPWTWGGWTLGGWSGCFQEGWIHG